MNTKICSNCQRNISLNNYERHVISCLKKCRNKITIKLEWLRENGKYKCPECGKEYSKHGIGIHIWRNHTDEGKKFVYTWNGCRKTYKSWNKGRTKETDERIKKSAETCSNNYKNNKNVSWCKGHTKETDERILKLSNKVKKTINEKIKNGTWHNSFSKAHSYEYNGLKFYGTWELEYAKYLDKNNIKWRKVTETFKYIFEDKERRYTPDFYLIDENCYVEIKGYETKKDRAKWEQFPLKLKVLKGKDLFELGIIKSYRNFKK